MRYDRRGEMARAGVSGIARQNRNYFWFRTQFRAPAQKAVALLRIGKAQFGTAVWLNGQKVGDDPACFSSLRFDVTRAVNWSGDNTLVVRIGAHPGVLPDTDAVESRALLSRLRSTLLAAMQRSGWPVGFSIGAATFLVAPASVDEMMARADALMYAAKREEKGSIRHGVFEGVRGVAAVP
jgi:predicted signal transduction protein with EAL and GGDEF domain